MKVIKEKSPEEQVIRQILSIYEVIASDLQGIDANKILHLRYEDFCQNVHKSLKFCDNFFRHNSLEIEQRVSLSKIPSNFLLKEYSEKKKKRFQEFYPCGKDTVEEYWTKDELTADG